MMLWCKERGPKKKWYLFQFVCTLLFVTLCLSKGSKSKLVPSIFTLGVVNGKRESLQDSKTKTFLDGWKDRDLGPKTALQKI